MFTKYEKLLTRFDEGVVFYYLESLAEAEDTGNQH